MGKVVGEDRKREDGQADVGRKKNQEERCLDETGREDVFKESL